MRQLGFGGCQKAETELQLGLGLGRLWELGFAKQCGSKTKDSVQVHGEAWQSSSARNLLPLLIA